MPRPKSTLSPGVKNSFIRVVELHLKKKKKDWNWLIDNGHFSRENVRSWLTGHKTPSIDNIAEIAFLLDIDKPKSMLANIKFNPSKDAASIRILIPEICEKKGIEAQDIYKHHPIPKNTVLNILNKGIKPQFETLVKFVRPLGVRSHLDLIQFKFTPDQFS